MRERLTPTQYRTLRIISECLGGRTFLIPSIWRDRHHQSLIKRKFLCLGADPFKTKANMLHGRITARGREALRLVCKSVVIQAKFDEARDQRAYAAEQERG